ncbi:hypothetical protein [Mycolicibacterium sphagni]|uniref:Uncharacterized protein n=1 Tax=Mycolicibacterium sphagni TaxID=1786 RepID=A0ABX2K1Y5_9MYCO|nr:hypothetical protein [Mycolicibacterium sphagni]
MKRRIADPSACDCSGSGVLLAGTVATDDVSRFTLRSRNAILLSAISKDPYERDMVRFAIDWREYGGGAAGQIFEEFGLAEHEFFRRVFLLIKTPTARVVLGQILAQQLTRMCLSRLHLDQSVWPDPDWLIHGL